MAQQVLKELEFATREVERATGSRDFPCRGVHFQISSLETKGLRRTTTAKEGADSSKQFGEREGLHEIVVGTEVQAEDSIVDRVAGRQNEHRRLEAPSSKGFQDFQPISTGKHQIQKHQIE